MDQTKVVLKTIQCECRTAEMKKKEEQDKFKLEDHPRSAAPSFQTIRTKYGKDKGNWEKSKQANAIVAIRKLA